MILKLLYFKFQYTNQQLNYQGVTVTKVEVRPSQGANNTFQTFWQQSDVDLSRGLDFVPRGNVFARFTHLQHTDFEYQVNVTNNTGRQTMGTCRIFMAPRNDERGTPMLFRDQRSMMTELDKFTIACKYFPPFFFTIFFFFQIFNNNDSLFNT